MRLPQKYFGVLTNSLRRYLRKNKGEKPIRIEYYYPSLS